ncbi:MAG: hypothetical protein OXB88_04980 [Bacteriovoracales bacterium]|nr:hypothetical protein [Bacteriovoracales bacterium]
MMKIKTMTFSTLFLLITAQALLADPLRSDSLRKMICREAIDTIELDSYLDITKRYETWLGDGIVLAPHFEEECEKSEESFQVRESSYNSDVGKVIGLDVEVDFESTEGFDITGNVYLARDVTFNRKGEIVLKNWSILESDLGHSIGPQGIERIAKLVVGTADLHNGDAELYEYDVEKFSLEREMARLKDEYERGDRSCRYEVSGSEDSDWIYEVINDYDDHVVGLGFLRERGYIKGIAMADTLGVWRESCAYIYVFIYLTNGSVIGLYYDLTT